MVCSVYGFRINLLGSVSTLLMATEHTVYLKVSQDCWLTVLESLSGAKHRLAVSPYT